MAEHILSVPDLGTTDVTFSLWLVEVGETVQAHDRVAEFLIPGAVVDLDAGFEGRLTRRLTVPGEKVIAGQIVGAIGDGETP